MESLQFINQNIIIKHQNTNYIYKLTQGVAKIVNQNEETVKMLQTQSFLNLVECLYSVPTLKTIQAVGKCQVKKIIMRESHKSFMKDLKQKGVRKSKFKIFEEIHSSKFYQLVRLGMIIELRKGEQFAAKNKYFYFMVSGSIIASQKQSKLKMFRLEQGSIWCGAQNQILFRSEVDDTKIIEVASNIVYCILQEKETELIDLAKYQNQTMQSFKQRNERVDKHIKRSKEKHFTKLVKSKNFANSMQFRYNNNKVNFNKLLKAKSCYLQENGQFKKPGEIIEEIKKENQAKFMELMEINKRKYRKNQLFCESIDKLYSLSCTATPEPSSPSRKISRQTIGNSNLNKIKNKENDNSLCQAQFAEAVCKILNRKQSQHLRKKTYSRNKAKLTFPMGISRKDSSQSLALWKLT